MYTTIHISAHTHHMCRFNTQSAEILSCRLNHSGNTLQKFLFHFSESNLGMMFLQRAKNMLLI